MSSQNDFEKCVNDDQQAYEQSSPDHEHHHEDEDIKKQLSPTDPIEEEDHQLRRKKEDRPPRFSTLYSTPPASLPAAPHQFESYPVPKRKSGVFLPTPLFVLFAVILLFESTILFAYTVIGLYANLPSQLMHTNSVGCNCAPAAEAQHAVNIAPNFIIQQPAQEHIVTTTAPGVLPDMVTPSSTSISSASTSSASSLSSLLAPDIASEVAGILTSLTTSTKSAPSMAIVTTVYTPPVSTLSPTVVATSVQEINVDANGSTHWPSTTTLVTVVSSSPSVQARTGVSNAGDVAAESSELPAATGSGSSTFKTLTSTSAATSTIDTSAVRSSSLV